MARQIVGEIFLNVKPLDGGVSSGVQKIIDNASTQATEVPITADTEQAEAAVASLAGSIENDIGTAWIAATAQAAAFTAAVIGVRRAAEQAVAKLAGIFDQLAQAQAGFTAILGSEQSGQQLLDDIREFARVSPFVTQELVNYSQQLLGVGQAAESIVPLLQNTGDLIASVGGDTQNISRVLFTLTQIRSIGRLVGQDAIQLQSSLIPITKLLADFLDITTQEVKKLQEQGAISADTVFAAINNAGSKVEGAMATATRNISGARSVLSDSIEILLQNSAFLQNVFEDIVQGILAFEAALGEPEIADNIDAIFDSLNKLYEGLQPLLDGFGSAAGAGAISALKLTAGALEILASAVEAIPAGALDLIGKSLAVMLALKAPLALLNYGTALRNIATAITPTNLAGNLARVNTAIAGTGNAAATSAAQMQSLEASTRRLGTAVGVAGVGLGLLVQNLAGTNQELQNVGSALTGAGIGAQLGTAFGPGGILAGAAIGGGIGFVSSLVTSTREEAERRAGELAAIGQSSAEAFLDGFDLRNPAGFTTFPTFENFLTEVEELQGGVDAYQATLENLLALKEKYADEQREIDPSGTGATGEELDRLNLLNTLINDITGSIEKQQALVDGSQAYVDSLFAEGAGAEALEELRSRLAALQNESPEFIAAMEKVFNPTGLDPDGGSPIARAALEAAGYFDNMEAALGQSTVGSSASLQALQEAFLANGTSIDAILTTEIPDLVDAFAVKVPNAIKDTQKELSTLKTLFDETKKGMDEFFSGFGLYAASAKTARDESEKLAAALFKLNDEGDGITFADELLKSIETISTAAGTVYEDQTKGLESGFSFARAAFEELRGDLQLTEDEFLNMLDSIGLLDTYLSSLSVDAGFAGSIIRLSSETGVAEDELRKLLNLQDDLSRVTELTVTADVVDALTNLTTIRDQIGRLPLAEQNAEVQRLIEQIEDIISLAGGVRITGGPLEAFDVGPEGAPLQPGDLQRIDATIGAEIRAAEEAARAAAEKAAEDARREAEKAQREAERLQREAEAEAERLEREREQYLREQEQLLRDYLNANETVADSLTRAADQIEAAATRWTQSIQERTQQEQAVPVDRLIRNAGQQRDDLAFIDTATQQLLNRGLSQDALDAIGIDGLGDVRQLERLLRSSNQDLQQLSQLVGQRDANAEAIARREQRAETQATIVAAIIQAAGILGIEGVDAARANQLAAQFIINGQPIDSAQLPPNLIDQLLNLPGQIVRG